MSAYRKVLKSSGVSLELVFKWFFDTYLNNEFDAAGFKISMPSEGSSYLEKCRMIASEIDFVLKQFRMFVELGHIDNELLQISSSHIVYSQIPSMLNLKYVYGKGDIYRIATGFFFSDQCMLSYVPRISNRYRCFYDLLMSEEVFLSDYTRYGRELEWLIENEFLSVDTDSKILINNKMISLLRDLYNNGVSNILYLSEFVSEISWMNTRDMLNYENTLFSIPEQEYLNYLMNRAEFSNGLDLRNKYIHGTQPADESKHEQDYCVFLNVLALIIIKINDEFCLYHREEKQQ
jgi:hypothetical protein